MSSDSFIVVDARDPRCSFDSGGIPGPEMQLLLDVTPEMQGVYRITGVWCERTYGSWRVRLHVESVEAEA